MHDILTQSKTILSKKYTAGSVYIIEMLGDMFAVLGFISEEEEPIYSRAFFFNEQTKKIVIKQARACFRQVKECLIQNKIDMLESLD